MVLAGPDQAWVADITYIRLPTTFAYLACVLDAWSRRCVGWALSRTIDTTVTLAALDHALTARHPAPGLIHHSDWGAGGPNPEPIDRQIAPGALLMLGCKPRAVLSSNAPRIGGVSPLACRPSSFTSFPHRRE